MITTPIYKFKKRQLTDSPPNIEVGEENWDEAERLFKAQSDEINILSEEKINKTQIINTLTEMVGGKVLDARQGKVLNDKIELAISERDQLQEGDNLNNFISGVYFWGSNPPINAPFNFANCLCYKSGSFCTQIITSMGALTKRIHVRKSNDNGSTWEKLWEIATTEKTEILPQISLLGGWRFRNNTAFEPRVIISGKICVLQFTLEYDSNTIKTNGVTPFKVPAKYRPVQTSELNFFTNSKEQVSVDIITDGSVRIWGANTITSATGLIPISLSYEIV